jgi:hypothetical protein
MFRSHNASWFMRWETNTLHGFIHSVYSLLTDVVNSSDDMASSDAMIAGKIGKDVA